LCVVVVINPDRTVCVKGPFGVSAFPEIDDEELLKIGTILNGWRGFNLSVYKDKCMKRRVAIRMRSTGSCTVAEYCDLLNRSSQELKLLQVLASLFASRSDGDNEPIRFWCLGCACGEEPYSLAILLREYFSRELRRVQTTILGTDIDDETLQAARSAEYNEERFKEMPPGLRERYFRQSGRLFRPTQEIREMVAFVKADISNVDEYVPSSLVFCRNTLIYFTRKEQEKILSGIADILPPDGILVLGKSESMVSSLRWRFTPVCQVERIYRRV
jgi:chemotaxis protein methyltransferase CheR